MGERTMEKMEGMVEKMDMKVLVERKMEAMEMA